MDQEQLTFAGLTATLKAAGEATRLRILALLAEAELTVSDLTEILRQSQPRLSRHLRLLAEARLVERFREGAWAFYRLGEQGGNDIARTLIALKAAGIWTIGLDTGGVTLSGPALEGRRVALVLGAEGEGLRRLTRETCDEIAGLHMPGKMESLNVSAAASVALYELTRRA